MRMKLLHVFTIFSTAESFFDGQFKYLSDKGFENIIVSSNFDKDNGFCKRNNVNFIPVEIPRSLSPIAITKAIIAICNIIRKEKPNAIVGHTPVGALCAMIAARICNIKNRIYYRHGLIYTTMSGVKYNIFKKEEQFVSGLSTHIINVSHSLSKLAIADKLNKSKKQSVIGYGTCGGIDAHNIFNPDLLDKSKLQVIKRHFGLAKADIIFGFCGRICNDKGIPELVDAFELFEKKHNYINSRLILIGELDHRDIISIQKQQQIALNKNIIITGHVNKDVIPYYYSLLDVFVFPSYREGFGMSVIEASAMKIPILVSKSHGCIDSIAEHETGEYIELSPESISKGMEMMLDKRLRILLGENGRLKVLKWYDSKVMWPQVYSLYKSILK